MPRIAVFVDHDIVIRHFLLSGILPALGSRHDLVFVLPHQHKRVRTDLASLGLGRYRTVAVAPPSASFDVGSRVADLERRIALLERKLEDAADVRERLERQVVAQTEELRVQRAAIARTQRVLRTLARPDDLPIEPAPRGSGPSGSGT